MKFAAFLALVFLLARESAACTCGYVPPECELDLTGTAAVFAGTVVSIEDPGGDRFRAMPPEKQMRRHGERALEGAGWGAEFGLKVTFRVAAWWKGDFTGQSVELWTGYGFGDCGYPFEKGLSYLVFADEYPDGSLYASICSRTKALLCAGTDLEWLGEAVTSHEPIDLQSLPGREEPYPTYWIPCLSPPQLIGERGLEMDKHCLFEVDLVVDREGSVSHFRFPDRPHAFERGGLCPETLKNHVSDRAVNWKFRPATWNGQPVSVRLDRISTREPATEAEFAKWAEEQRKWKEAQQKAADRR